MIILQLEHPVANFDGWKKAFENDPIGRQRGGVVRYNILKKIDDPNYVIINLEFEQQEQAESFLELLKQLWGKVEGSVMNRPQARILQLIEAKTY
jgi:hypothetical protein